MKKSFNHLIGIFLKEIVWFTGLGVILSVILVLNRVVPDTLGIILLIIAPFFLFNVYYFLHRYCNSIVFEKNSFIIKTFTGDKILYFKKDVVGVEIVEYRAYGVEVGYVLVLKTQTAKEKVWRLGGYSKLTIQEIISKLAD